MTLCYDFDVHDIDVEQMTFENSLVDFKGKVGFKDGGLGKQMVLFRDQKTIDTILAGAPCVVGFLKACGFGFRRSENELPVGVYAKDEEDIRMQVVGNADQAAHLLENAHGVIPERFAEGFSFSEFLEQLFDAVPLSNGAAQTDVSSHALPSLLSPDALNSLTSKTKIIYATHKKAHAILRIIAIGIIIYGAAVLLLN